MKLTIATRDILRALRVLGPILARTNVNRVYACQLLASGANVIIRTLDNAWETRLAIPATVDTPGHAWIPGDLLRAIPWATLGETVHVQEVKSGLAVTSPAGTYTAGLMSKPKTQGIPQGARAATAIPGPMLAQLLHLGMIATIEQNIDKRWLLLYGADGTFTADAWNGMWLSRATAVVPTTQPVRCALPLAMALSIAQAAALSETVTILTHPSKAVVTFAAGDSTLTTRIFQPDVADTTIATLPDLGTWSTSLNASELAIAVRHALAVAGTDPTAAIRVHASADTFTVWLAPAPDHGRLAGFTTAVPATNHAPWTERLSGRALLRYLAPLGNTGVQLHQVGQDRGIWVTTTLPGLVFSGRLPAVDPARDTALVADEPAIVTA